jgi:drug/metabolite transporter (DMT)-like permease
MTESTRPLGGITLATFAAAVVLGGGNFLAVRFSNRELQPFWGAGLRFGLAAICFVAIAVALRLQWPRGRQLASTALYGLFTFALSYALMYWALVTVTAGVAAVVLAVVPLVTPLLAAAQRLEPLSRRMVTGALVALAGILVMTVGPEGLVIPIGGLVAILIAAVTIGQSVIIAKRLSGNHPVMTNAVGMSVGAGILLVLSAGVGEQWSLPSQPEAVWSVAYLVLGGSVGLFVLTLLVVRSYTASATSYMFVLFPLVTMLAEAWLADEPLTVRGGVGALVVMGGVWFGVLAPRRRADTPVAREEPAPSPAR